MVLGVGDGIERRLRVARAGEHAGKIAGLGPPVALIGFEVRLDQPQEGAPGLHRGAEIVHRDGFDALAVLHRRPAFGQEVAAMSRSASPTACSAANGLVTHATVI